MSIYYKVFIFNFFFRNLKVHNESKTKSWTTCPVCPQAWISLWTVWTFKYWWHWRRWNHLISMKKKSQQSARIISIFCFSFTVLFAFSLLLFCLFSVVHHTQKFNLKLSPLIDLVINICPGKMWLFYLKLEVNMVFLWAGSSTFPLVSLFHEFWFLLFQWWSSLGQWWRKKDEQDKYSIDEDDHDHEDSNEEHVDCAPIEKK